MEMASQKEKPGVITPSRNPALRHGLREAIIEKEKPPLPKARRSGFARVRIERNNTEVEVMKTHTETKLLSERPVEVREPPQVAEKPPSDQEVDTKPVAPRPPDSTKPSAKKPPPAPKARRWRGKRIRDDAGGPREPGKIQYQPSFDYDCSEEILLKNHPSRPSRKPSPRHLRLQPAQRRSNPKAPSPKH